MKHSANKKKRETIRLIFEILIVFLLFLSWIRFTARLDDQEKRIRELEMSARPLIVVDRYSQVFLNGEEVEAEANLPKMSIFYDKIGELREKTKEQIRAKQGFKTSIKTAP